MNPTIEPQNRNLEEQSPIVDFYRDKNIFITGASGFIGKVLVEKLLYTCPNLNKIYILLRTKKGQTIEKRIDKEFAQCKVFERVNKDLIRSKIQALEGDLTSDNFGLSAEDLKTLLDNTNIVFHVAASVRFDEPLRESLRYNVLGTKTVLDLCHQMLNLDCLVHVSTAYAYCHLNKSDECLYPLKSTANQLLEATKWMDDETLKQCSNYLMEGRPNAYTYTKAVAEHFLNDNRGQLPVAIVRPSIVTSSLNEPFPGWIDSVNGPSGLTLLAGLGIARTVDLKPKKKTDLIPIDIVTNAIIVIAWKTASDYRKQQSPNNNNETSFDKSKFSKPDLPIYNITSGNENPITWENYFEYGKKTALEMPSIKSIRLPGKQPKGDSVNWYSHILKKYFSELLFAYLVDFFLFVSGHKTSMVRIVQKTHTALDFLHFFSNREWSFPCKNVLNLYDSLNEKDKELFNFDVRKVNWEKYMKNFAIGIRRHLMKESDDNIPKAKRRMERLQYIYSFLNTISVILFISAFLWCFPFREIAPYIFLFKK